MPVADVSLVDLTFKTKKETSLKEINAAMKKASESSMSGVLGYTEEEVVSSDFISDRRSSIFDAGAGVEFSNSKFFFKVGELVRQRGGLLGALRRHAHHDGQQRRAAQIVSGSPK